MSTIKINQETRLKLIEALKTGKFNLSDFPELESNSESFRTEMLTDEEKAFLHEINERLINHHNFKEFQTLTIDHELKLAIVKALYVGAIENHDLQHYAVKSIEVPDFEISVEDQIELWRIIRKTQKKSKNEFSENKYGYGKVPRRQD